MSSRTLQRHEEVDTSLLMQPAGCLLVSVRIPVEWFSPSSVLHFFLVPFLQACYYTTPGSQSIGRQREVILTTVTFGLGQACMAEHMDMLQAMPMMLTQPALLLVLIWLTWLLARNVWCATLLQRWHKRNSLLHVLWLVIICSYSVVAVCAIRVLICLPLAGRNVLFFDGSIECFGSRHYPYAVAAIILLCVFVIPFPFCLVWLSIRPWHKLKGFIDEAMHIYEDNRRWWVGVNVLRQLAMAAMFTFAHDGYTRSILLAVLMVIFLCLHYVFRQVLTNDSLLMDPVKSIHRWVDR